MKCILCRACQVQHKALWRKLHENQHEQTNYREMWKKEQHKDRLAHAYDLWSSDPLEAYREHRALAEAESAWAMTALGWAYETGTGTRADLFEAGRWYERAFAAGSEWALYGLGRIHFATGAYDELERVYVLGVERGLPHSMYGLARLRMKRPTSVADRTTARVLLERATVLGDLEAKRYLANLLMGGRFGWRSIPTGFRMFSSWLDEVTALVDEGKAPTTELSAKTITPLTARSATA